MKARQWQRVTSAGHRRMVSKVGLLWSGGGVESWAMKHVAAEKWIGILYLAHACTIKAMLLRQALFCQSK